MLWAGPLQKGVEIAGPHMQGHHQLFRARRCRPFADALMVALQPWRAPFFTASRKLATARRGRLLAMTEITALVECWDMRLNAGIQGAEISLGVMYPRCSGDLIVVPGGDGRFDTS